MRRAFCSKTPAPAIRVAFQAQAKMLESRAVQRPAIHLAPNPGQRRRPIRHPERSRLARDRAPEPVSPARAAPAADDAVARGSSLGRGRDRKSTRLNSSHLVISYAVFCLKKKKNTDTQYYTQSMMS